MAKSDPTLLSQARSELWGEDIVNASQFGGAAEQAAVVGEFSRIQLENPAGSGKRVYVLDLYVSTGAGSTIKYAFGIALETGESTARNNLDANDASAPALDLHTGSDATGLAANAHFRIRDVVAGGSSDDLTKFPIVLRPGDVLTLEDQTANEAMRISAVWVERDAGTLA